jgi:RNA polymerase sigma-70 factor (ECF subfamily)
LHRLTVNVVLNERKTDRRRMNRVEEVEDFDDVVDAGSVGDVGPGLAIDLEAAIKLLPPGARRVFVLHDVEGFTHVEIGQMLGVTPGGTKAQLHRARLLLRKALQR